MNPPTGASAVCALSTGPTMLNCARALQGAGGAAMFGVDWAGTVCFSAANALLVLALIRGNEDGWGSTAVLGSLIAAALLLCSFVAIESRVGRPMLPLRYFRNHAFTGTQIAAFAVSASMFALYLYITLYIQNILGHTALETGLIYLPSTIVSLGVAGGTAVLMARVQPRALLSAGLAVTALGMVVMSGRTDGDTWTAASCASTPRTTSTCSSTTSAGTSSTRGSHASAMARGS